MLNQGKTQPVDKGRGRQAAPPGTTHWKGQECDDLVKGTGPQTQKLRSQRGQWGLGSKLSGRTVMLGQATKVHLLNSKLLKWEVICQTSRMPLLNKCLTCILLSVVFQQYDLVW